ncbi:MAG: TIGR02710 family CRISPR-associated CARF protein [Pseudomonadota bacterium]
MKRALIISVGTGTRPDVDITKPLIKTINDCNPDYTVMIASQKSESNALKIKDNFQFTETEYNILKVSTIEDIQQIFKEVNPVFRELFRAGYEPEEIVVDYTSGTKAMTGGLVLSAVANSCGTFRYISGDRQDGVVQNETEKFINIKPKGVFAINQIQVALRLMEELRFDSALEIFKSINKALLDEYEIKLLDSVETLARAYDRWDMFDHLKFFSEYDKVKFQYQELHKFKINQPVHTKVLAIGKVLKDERTSPDVLVDLYNNALRRFYEGKYDDALARLYRASEMLAQYILYRDFQIKTGDVDLAKVPEEKRGDLAAHKDDRDGGKIKIGLKRAYALLADLGSSTGKAFVVNKELQGVLNERNNSILAHGTKPITEKACRKLFDVVKNLLSSDIADFEIKADALQFPWTKGRQLS